MALLRTRWIHNSTNIEVNKSVIRLFKKDIEDLVAIICPNDIVDFGHKKQLLKAILPASLMGKITKRNKYLELSEVERVI